MDRDHEAMIDAADAARKGRKVNPDRQVEETMTRFYAIFCELREKRPSTYRQHFSAVLDALHNEGPEAANALVASLLA